jgi:hypothetical protein
MQQLASPQTGRIRRIGRRIGDVVAEYTHAQRRMTELAMAPDRYAFRPNVAPDTFAEFLFRTSGVLRHEPPACARATR